MTRQEYEERNARIQGDTIYDALMKLVEDGQQDQFAVEKTIRRLANVLYMKDFYKRELADYGELGEEELELIASIMRSKAQLAKIILKKKKPTIPGVKPGEVDNVHTYEAPEPIYTNGKSGGGFGGSLRKPTLA